MLPIDPTRRFKNYIVQGPDKKTTDRLSPPDDQRRSRDRRPAADRALDGRWPRVLTERPRRSASASIRPLSETQFVPLETADLDRLFGGRRATPSPDDPDEPRTRGQHRNESAASSSPG